MMERPVMVYNGGKFLLKDWVIENLPEHEIYVEPFGGAGSVLMAKPRATREVYNDINSTVYNVFKVLRDKKKAKELKRLLELTPFSREEVWTAKKNDKRISDIEKARRTIVCAFQSRSRQSRDGKGMRYSKLANRGPEKDWVNYVQCIPAFTDRLQGVMLENKKAIELIDFWDSKYTLFYCDPPYLFETRGDSDLYEFEMTDEQHNELLEKLNDLSGMVILIGYRSGVYDQALSGWRRIERQTKTAQHKNVTECLWLNESAQTFARQQSFAEVSW